MWPIYIKHTILSAIDNGDFNAIDNLQDEIEKYYQYFKIKIYSTFSENTKYSTLFSDYEEYKTLISQDIRIDDDDIVYLQDIVPCFEAFG